MREHRFDENYKWIYKTQKGIRFEIYNLDYRFSETLIRLALYGSTHPFYKMWVCKCTYILEFIGRFKMKSGNKVIERRYHEFFTSHNQTERETKERLGELQNNTEYGEFTIDDETVKRVFAICDSVRISAVPYLMDCNERYFASEYASLIEQAVDGGVKKQHSIDYDKKIYGFILLGGVMTKEKVTVFYGDEESVEARFNLYVESLTDGRTRSTYDENIFFVIDYRASHGKFSNIREYPDLIYKYCSGMIYEYRNRADKRAISGEQFEIFKQKCQLFYKNFKNISIHRGHGKYVTIAPDLHLKVVRKVDGKERTADLSMGDYIAFYFLCWLQYIKFFQYIGEKCDGPLVIYGLTEFLDIYFPIEDLLKEALSTGKKVYLYDTCSNTEERFAQVKTVNLVKVKY